MKTSARLAQLASTSALLACLSATESSSAQVLHLLGAVNNAWATGVSDDGTVAAGYDPGSYWYWTEASWVVQLTGITIPPGSGVGGSACIRGDGSQMSCSSLQGEPAKAEGSFYDLNWTEVTPIGSTGFNCDIERNGIWDMSPDGQHSVGLSWQNGCAAAGFHWNIKEGFKLLPTSYFFKPTRANAVSNDGNVIAGWSDDYNGYRQGSVWTRNAAGNYIQTLMTSPPLPLFPVLPIKVIWFSAVPVKLVSPVLAITRRPLVSSHAMMARLAGSQFASKTTTPLSDKQIELLPLSVA